MNRLNNQTLFDMDEYTEKDRVASVARRLYSEYKDVRRPDRTRLWKTYTAMQSVLSVAIRENAIPFFSKGRAKYCKDSDARRFLDEYIDTRIHSNGNTRSPIEEIEVAKPSKVRFNIIQRLLGINKIVGSINHLVDVQLRMLEQTNELNEVWKPSSRSNASNGSTVGADAQGGN